MPLTYLIIGANRGLGLEFVHQLAAKHGVTVLATTRSLKSSTELVKLAEGKPQIQLFEADFTSEASLKTLASVVPPFNRLLVNAGIMQGAETLLDESDSTTTEDLLRMLDVNVVAPVKTIRALLPVLKKADTSAEDGKKILLMSSQLGSIDLVGQWSASTKGGYSVSKSALNMAGRKMGVELEGTGVSLMLMHPGWVKTELGGDDAPVEKKDSIAGMLKVLETAGNGSYLDFEGNKLNW